MSVIDPIRTALNRVARHVVIQSAGAAVVAYFAYHAIHGDRGLVAMTRLQGEIEQAQAVLAEVTEERERMEHRSSLLRPEGLDPDMLDERARVMLNFSHPDEIVILRPRPKDAPVETQAAPEAVSR